MKRTVALFLTFGMLLCILAGCGQVTDPVPQTTETTQTPPTTIPTASTAAPTEPPYQFPAGASLEIEVPITASDTLLNDFINEATGLDVNFWYHDGLDNCWSSVQYSLICTDNFKDSNFYGKYGAYVNLMDYRHLLPNFFAFFDSEKYADYREKSLTPDENTLYCAPVFADGSIKLYTWMYREDIFRELDLEPPTNWDSFYALLKALKAAYPESYPFTMRGLDGSLSALREFALQFGIDYCTDSFALDENKKHYDFSTTDEMRNMLARLCQLLDEGLMSKASLSNKLPQMINEMAAGTSFITYERAVQLQRIESAGQALDADFSLGWFHNIPMVESDLPYTIRQISRPGYYWSVYSAAPDLEAAIRYLDWMYSDEGITTLSWGKEGISYGVDAEGNKYFLENYDMDAVSKARLAKVELSGYVDFQAELAFCTEKNRQLILETITETEKGGLYPNKKLSFPAETQITVDTYRWSYMDARHAYLQKFLTGELDIHKDAHWQEMKDALETNGVSQLLEAYNTAYQANNRE